MLQLSIAPEALPQPRSATVGAAVSYETPAAAGRGIANVVPAGRILFLQGGLSPRRDLPVRSETACFELEICLGKKTAPRWLRPALGASVPGPQQPPGSVAQMNLGHEALPMCA